MGPFIPLDAMTRARLEAVFDEARYTAGYAAMSLVKTAAEAVPTYSLGGRLVSSKSGWLLLEVPNAMVQGAFAALHEPGARLPVSESEGRLRAHISVMRSEEVEKIGGPGVINELGKTFKYQLGPIKSVKPAGWDGVSKVWFISVAAPELQLLRKTYGLPALPVRNGEEIPFHITVAVRDKGVLHNNEVSKVAAAHPALQPLIRAKRESDRQNYLAKHSILKALLDDTPADFLVDSKVGRFGGLTHVPTGFKIHAPMVLIPASVRAAGDLNTKAAISPLFIGLSLAGKAPEPVPVKKRKRRPVPIIQPIDEVDLDSLGSVLAAQRNKRRRLAAGG